MAWNVIVKKGEFKEGDLCVYFEIDSKASWQNGLNLWPKKTL